MIYVRFSRLIQLWSSKCLKWKIESYYLWIFIIISFIFALIIQFMMLNIYIIIKIIVFGNSYLLILTVHVHWWHTWTFFFFDLHFALLICPLPKFVLKEVGCVHWIGMRSARPVIAIAAQILYQMIVPFYFTV